MEHAPDGLGAADSGPVTIVDSILPIEEEIRRFREMAPGVPTRLTGGASSRDALVRRWVRAVERADTAAFRDMIISPEEYITFYYPYSRYTAPPWRQSPRLRWFLMSSSSSRGATRVLQRHGGEPFGYRSYRCAAEDRVGNLRVWSECTVRRRVNGQEGEMRYFGAIIAMGGVYKFLSYASDY